MVGGCWGVAAGHDPFWPGPPCPDAGQPVSRSTTVEMIITNVAPPCHGGTMTVLDLDPPPSPLRLVSSNGPTTPRTTRHRSSSPLHGSARVLYCEILQAAIAARAAVDPDALRVVLATKQATTAAPIRAFTAEAIWQLMFVDVVAWCRNRRLDAPAGCAAALIRIVEHLESTDSFDVASDPVDELYDAIDECTGGWVDDHPSTAGRTTRSLRSKRGTKRT